VSIDWKQAIAYLKPRLPDDGHPAGIHPSHGDSPVLRDLGNGLLVAYVVDEGESFAYVQNRHLLDAGIDQQILHQTAVGNLHALAEKHLRIQPYGTIFAVFMEGNFEASVLLLDTVWDVSLKDHVHEGFMAAAPSRDVLAFGDSSSSEAIAELRAVIARLEQADHQLSTSLFWRKGSMWLPWNT
jgi:uncharacterized protein YtpQ (UPF0354 family)